jgi:rubrerythrin
MSEAKTTTDHEQIKQWVEERGGHPARVAGTAVEGSSGVLLIDYPGYSGTQALETISWDEFFQGFEENKLAFLYQDETKAGDESRFSKLITRESAEEKGHAAGS